MKGEVGKLGFWGLVFSIFFCVSGGPYGLEETIGSGGVSIGLLLILVVPFFWSLPVALMTAELGTAMPEEGGYITWVERAFGPFPAFLCGWWSWVYAWIDVAIYPVLFVGYLQSLMALLGHPIAPTEVERFGLSLFVIAPFTILNILGVSGVGRASIALACALISPFVIFAFSGPPISLQSLPKPEFSSLGTALFAAMWNYLGWDTMSTVAKETKNPQKNLPKALITSLLIIVFCYSVPTLIALRGTPDPSAWTENGWPLLVAAVAGKPLGVFVAMMALASSCGQFNSMLMGTSRVPKALASKGWLHPWLSAESNKFKTPVRAILVSAVIYSILSLQQFKDLAVADVILYSAALLLELMALVVLRRKEPSMQRPYKIPGGWPVLALIALLPTLLIGFACTVHMRESFAEKGPISLALIGAALLTGPVVYSLRPPEARRRGTI